MHTRFKANVKSILKVKIILTRSNTNEDNKDEANEPDYDKVGDQLQEKLEEETPEKITATINNVF